MTPLLLLPSTYAGWTALVSIVAALVLLVAVLTRSADDDLDRIVETRVDDREHDPSVGLGVRVWMIDGARVVNDRFGVGTVLEPDDPRPGYVLVAFDVGTVVELLASEVGPITARDELILRELRAAREAADAARAVAAAAPPVDDLVPAYCDGLMSCTTHDVERCADRPCCSTCPLNREDDAR